MARSGVGGEDDVTMNFERKPKMKRPLNFSLPACCRLRPQRLADVRCVDVNSTNATPPYIGWATAATNIRTPWMPPRRRQIVVTTASTPPAGVVGWPHNKPSCCGQGLSLRSVNGP